MRRLGDVAWGRRKARIDVQAAAVEVFRRFRVEVERLLGVLRQSSCRVIIVTNEVGLGIMPADRLSRRYQNQLGAVNRRIAAAADRVYMLVAGIPVTIK